MRFLAVCLIALSVAGCPKVERATPPILDTPPPPPTLAGVWEGELPRPGAPIRLELQFERGDASNPVWTGSVSAPNTPTVSMEKLQVVGDKVTFSISAEVEVAFAGALKGDVLEMTVNIGSSLSMTLWRVPPVAAVADRAAAWRADLETVRDRFLRFDRSFDATARAAAIKALDALAKTAGELEDGRVIAELSRIIASAGNAHTRLYLLRNRTALARLPIRLWWFGDDLRVVRATTEHRDLLGCSVTSIGGRPVGAAAAAVAPLFAGNASWRRYKNVYFLTAPAMLAAVGVIAKADAVALDVRCPAPRAVTLAPMALEVTDEPTEAWRDLLPPGDGWVGASEDALPAYLKQGDKNYLVERSGGDLHVHYRRAAESEGAPFAAFADEVRKGLADAATKRVIVDLRLNTGGSLDLGWTLFGEIAAHAKANKGNVTLIVLTSRATFSAGITHVAQLVESGVARVVGEPVGDELDTWSEGGNLVLPHSKLTVHYTSGFHAYSKKPYPDRELFRDLDVKTVAPIVRVEPTYIDYQRGRDPILKAAQPF